MSLKELVKIADYYDIKYSLNKEAQDTNVGVYSTPDKPARTWTGETFQSKEPYILEDKPGFIEKNWNAAKDIAKDYISNQMNQSSKVPPAKPKPTAPNTQLTKLQKDLYALKAKANSAKDPALAKQVNDFIYQVSQNKLSLSQIQSKMNELNGKLNPVQTQQPQQTVRPSAPQPTTPTKYEPDSI